MKEVNYILLSDEELAFKIAKTHNSDYFEVLYDRYEQKVFNKCYSFSNSIDEAKDLTQDVFLKLFIKIHTFKGESKFSSWLYSLTYNFCVNYVNRNKERKIQDVSNSLENDEEVVNEVDDQSFYSLKMEKLKTALNLIAPEDKSILLLKYLDDIPIKELQDLLGISESAVKMRLKRAKSRTLDAYKTLIE